MVYLNADTAANNGYAITFRPQTGNVIYVNAYEISNGSWTDLGGGWFSWRAFNWIPGTPTVARVIKAANGIRVTIGAQDT